MVRYRRIAAIVVALVSVAVVSGVSSSTQADTYSESGSVELSSLPTAQVVKIAQFDPSLGTLTAITVTAHLAGGVDATVTNLSTVSQATTVAFDTVATADGPGGIDLAVSAHDESASVLQPGVPLTISLSGEDDDTKTTSAAADLAAFTGTGTVDYNVSGSVVVEVNGPAKWRTRGVAHANAAVTVRYEFTPPETTTSSTTPTTESTTSSSLPGSSVPGSSVPDSSTPDSSTPDSSTPDSSTPDSSAPDSSAPDSSAPGSSAPGSSAPGSSAPGSSAPGSSAPGSSAPGSSAPGSSAPGSSTPNPSVPGSSASPTSNP